MGTRFLLWFTIAFASTLALLGGVGLALARFGVSQPRELYRNAAFEFDLAPGWWCERNETEDICSPNNEKQRPAVAIITAKYRGPQDTLDAYEAHLRTPQHVDRDDPTSPLAEIRYVRRSEIAGRSWVESLHVGSEVKNYNTYYLATTTSHVGVLVTLSVHQRFEDRYIGEFNRMMQSLKTYQR